MEIPGTVLLTWQTKLDHQDLINPINKFLDQTKGTMLIKGIMGIGMLTKPIKLTKELTRDFLNKLKLIKSRVHQLSKWEIIIHQVRDFTSNTIPTSLDNECKGITTRSGVVLDGPLPPMPPPFVNPDNEVAKETEVTKDQVQLNSSQSTARVQPPVVQIREKVQNKGKEPIVEIRVDNEL
ncbi:hypothetical protein Tco_0349150 [Tanacetum coccineum]